MINCTLLLRVFLIESSDITYLEDGLSRLEYHTADKASTLAIKLHPVQINIEIATLCIIGSV